MSPSLSPFATGAPVPPPLVAAARAFGILFFVHLAVAQEDVEGLAGLGPAERDADDARVWTVHAF